MSKQEACKGISVGDTLAGKYRVDKILGMGGMGVVVAATHLDLRDKRAIKLIRPDAKSEQSVERFLREARAVVRLRSEHVAEVHDVGRLETGAPYIVMELLEGQDLSAMLKMRGPLPIEEAILYVTQACHALAEAHAVGIVHRDLKPGNLFITRRPDGSACVKVLDFGISKDTKPDKRDPEMTGAKDLIGSPSYMSPEQMRSARKVDARADVWALGAILYKLLTGKTPFHAPTVPEIFALTLAKEVRPPSTLRPEISNDLDAIILRCLDKDPQNRYATAGELGAALMPYGPWPAEVADAADQCFRPMIRRTSIPPEPPAIPIDVEMADQVLVSPEKPSVTSCPDRGEALMGLARSNKFEHPVPSPSWTDSRGAWLVFVSVLSLLSAFVGALVVTFFAHLTEISMMNRLPEVSNAREILPQHGAISPAPSPPMAPNDPVVESPPNAAPSGHLVYASPQKVLAKPLGSNRFHAAPSAEAPRKWASPVESNGRLRIPAKPETKSATPQDPAPRRD